MKILLVVLSFPPERFIGAELYDLALAEKLISEGHEVKVLTREQAVDKNWRLGEIEINPVEHECYDMVITHCDMRFAGDYARRLYSPEAKLVGIIHNEAPSTLGWADYLHWDGVISNCDFLAPAVKRWPRFVLTPPSPKPLAKPLQADRKYLAFQTNFTEGKGGKKYFEAVASAWPGEKHLASIGGWGEQEIPEGENIILREHKPITEAEWASVSVLLLPSVLESWSMVAAEAAAHGVPTVTFDSLSGVRENLKGAGVYVSRESGLEGFLEGVEAALELDSSFILQEAEKTFSTHSKQMEEVVAWLENL